METTTVLFGLLSIFAIGTKCYVVDKTIEKPTEEPITINSTENARRQWPSYKRFEIRKRADEDPEEVSGPAAINNIKDIIVSVDTGAKIGHNPYMDPSKPNPLDTIKKALMDITRSPNNPIYRAQEHYNIKPKLVQFRTQDSPSLKLEINSQSILRALNDLLSSQTVKKYADIAARKAALLYNSLNDEITRNEPSDDRMN